MAKIPDPDKPFKFPQSILNQISECSPGGYILFYIERGEPQISADFENSINELGLRSFVTTFISSINSAESISNTNELLNSDMPPPDLDDSGGEDFTE